MSTEVNRRELIRIGAAAALTGAVSSAAPIAGNPKFFTPAEFAMLDELAEIIIPADGHSPGARAADVAACIDGRLAEAFEAKDRDDWRNGLKLVDALSQKMHDAPFMHASAAQRVDVVAAMAKNEMNPNTPEQLFFRDLKRATARAYYTSKIGIHQEMEYKGNVMLREFVGAELK